VRDALDKSYLKALSFAIFLDPEQPNNIVECYTYVRVLLFSTLPGGNLLLHVRGQLQFHLRRGRFERARWKHLQSKNVGT
jgi:hypothetical protein